MKAVAAKKRKGVYKFVVRQDIEFETALKSVSFENDWLRISSDGVVTVKGTSQDGYAWDGCTPKWNLFDLFLFGTPDGRVIVNTEKPITYYASMIHDVLLQFKDDIGIKRKDADHIFLHYLGDFNLRYLYFIVVRGYGMISDLFPKAKSTDKEDGETI